MSDLQLIAKGRLAEVFAWGDTQVLKLFAAGRAPNYPLPNEILH